jgi:hypothetical protein
VAVLLKISATDYQTYFNGAQFVHFLSSGRRQSRAHLAGAQIRYRRRRDGGLQASGRPAVD